MTSQQRYKYLISGINSYTTSIRSHVKFLPSNLAGLAKFDCADVVRLKDMSRELARLLSELSELVNDECSLLTTAPD